MTIDRFLRGARCAAFALLLSSMPLAAQTRSGVQAPATAPDPAAAAASGRDLAAEAARRQTTQPLNNAPVWREVRSGQPQYTTARGVDAGILIQSSGETWREARGPIAFWGGMVVALSILSLSAFYVLRGTMGRFTGPRGRVIERFSPMDRYAHWMLASIWTLHAITGLVLSLGKTVLLPLIGYTLFSWVAIVSKWLHNFLGPLLIIAVPWVFIRFVRDNRFGVEDIRWFSHMVDYFKGHEYPSDRFNGGEKMVFWGLVVVLSTVLVVSGTVMLFPNFGFSRATMQVASTVHMIASYIAIAIALVHVYLGTIGMAGAYQGMKTGYVDEAWASHHHYRWYERVKAGKAREKFVEPAAVPSGVVEPARTDAAAGPRPA